MTKKHYSIATIILILIGIILMFELVRDSMRNGDFIGYLNAGNAVLDGKNIYLDQYNTWPPFFSIFSVILAFFDNLSCVFIKFIWLLGSVLSMFFIINESIKLIFNKPISFKKNYGTILIQNPIILIPLLIVLRFVIDNLANLQINIYMLLCSLLSIVFFIKKKYMWVGFLLGLTISLKVYTIFFLFYFLIKREFKPVLWTFVFLIGFNSISFLVFGYEQTIIYYQQWVTEIAPKSYIANHNNQSIFGSFLRFFTSENSNINLHVNVLDLKPYAAKKLTYLSIILFAIFPAVLLRKKLVDKSSFNSILEYSLLFIIVPLLSPIAWKAYFIFLWIPYFVLYISLFKAQNELKSLTIIVLKFLFYLSIVFTVFSTEAVIGHYYSDILEAYSVITIGTLILLFITLFLITKSDKLDVKKLVSST